jgi:hypothetical protein
MKIDGINGMTLSDLEDGVQAGGKLVSYQYCISLFLITFTQPSRIFYIKPGHSRTANGLIYSLMTFIIGWWGVPVGPIYTIRTLIANFAGGKDVTPETMSELRTLAEAQEMAKALVATA